jgi:tetratricopeptide (TPR) repeat protein
LSIAAASGAGAQNVPATPGAASKSAEQDALFQRILKNPGDLDTTFRHAEVATANGDYEAAIGSLERLLFYNPNLPRVMLELGVLYFRLGSFEMSREYFNKAIAAPDTPAEVRVRVEAYLAEIQKRLNPSLTTVFVQTGARHQTNANAGPNGTLVRVFGNDATLDRRFVKAADWNWFAQGTVRNVIDFGNQRGDAWETTLNGYWSQHEKFGRLDTALYDIQTGPRFAIFPDAINGWTVRPYVGATGVHLGSHNYLSAQTYGASIGWLPAPGWNLEVGIERTRRSFYSSDEYATASDQTGYLQTLYGTAQGPLLGGWTWSVRGALGDNDARQSWLGYRQRGADLSLIYATAWNVLGNWRRITFIPFAGIIRTDYDAADPLVDPSMAREDLERRVGIAVDAQVTERIGLGVRMQYSRTDSNIINYDTNNLSVFGGPTIRF